MFLTRMMRSLLHCLAVRRSLPALRAHRERRIGAALIQRAWRLHRDWWKFKNYYLARKRAATMIQAMFRGRRMPRWRNIRMQRWSTLDFASGFIA